MTDRMPILGADRDVAGPPSRWRKRRWLAFLLSMLAFHMYPVSDLVHRGWSAWALVAVLVPEAAFAALWVRTNWLAMGTNSTFRAIAPWLATTVGLGVTMTMVLGGQYKGLLIYVSIACAVSVPPRWILPSLVASALVGFGAEFRNARYLGLPPGTNRLQEIVTGVCLIFFLGLMMSFYRKVMLLINELRGARSELAGLAVTEERLRFARDLHDLLGHSLTTIALKSQVARRLADPGSAVAREVTEIETVAQQALTEVREAVTGYRGRTFAEELDSARDILTAAGIEVTVSTAGPPRSGQVDALLGWVVREGTTNVLRHSRARSCSFTLSQQGSEVTLEVVDDGVGGVGGVGAAPGPGGRGNGLAGLCERLAGAGGRLEFGSGPTRGFRLTARMPTAPADPAPHPDAVADRVVAR